MSTFFSLPLSDAWKPLFPRLSFREDLLRLSPLPLLSELYFLFWTICNLAHVLNLLSTDLQSQSAGVDRPLLQRWYPCYPIRALRAASLWGFQILKCLQIHLSRTIFLTHGHRIKRSSRRPTLAPISCEGVELVPSWTTIFQNTQYLAD